MTLERHQALAEIESRLAGSERLRESYFRFGGLEACLTSAPKAIPEPLEADFRAFEAPGVSRPTPNPYPSVYGPILEFGGTRTQSPLPLPCSRCLHALNFQPFPLLHTLS